MRTETIVVLPKALLVVLLVVLLSAPLNAIRLDFCFYSKFQLTDRQGPAPLVTVPTSDTIPGTVKPKAMASTGTSAIAVSVSDDFWSNTSTISSRSRQKGLQYAVEGYPKY